MKRFLIIIFFIGLSITILLSSFPKQKFVEDNEIELNYADKFFEQYKFNKSINLYSDYLKKDPNNIHANLFLAKSYYEVYQYEKSKQLFLNVLNLNPNNYVAFNGLGFIMIRNNNFKYAEKLFKKSLDIKNNFNPVANIGIGISYFFNNESNKFEKLINETPKNGIYDYELYIEIGKKYYELKKVNLSNHYFDKGITISNFDKLSYIYLGETYFELGVLNKSEEIFNKLIELDKKTELSYPCPYEGLGIIYYKLGKKNDSKNMYEIAQNISNNLIYKKYNNLAKEYLNQNNIDQAIIYLKKSIESYPHDNEAKLLLSGIEDKNEKNN
jgi:tetratricopeptide (TPR) repeat protein